MPPSGVGALVPLHYITECDSRAPTTGSAVLQYKSQPQTHQVVTSLTAILLVILLLPVIILLWASESRQQRARRWRRAGMTQQAIADRLHCSRSTVRRLLAG
jgi:DNA-binding NarL/FixJ family response regulator